MTPGPAVTHAARVLPILPGQCSVCRLPETGIGFAPIATRPPTRIAWVCDACGPDLARTVFAMPADRLNRLEEEAVEEAGAVVGEWVDTTGKGTDFAEWSRDDYRAYLSRFLLAFGASIRAKIAANAAPF